MAMERPGIIQFKGRSQTAVGPDITVGMEAPDFVVIGQDWSERRPVAEERGKVLVLAAVTSLDTSVCDRESRRFNEEAVQLGEDVRIVVISADLPPAQARWCGAAGVDRVTTLSDSVHVDFGTKYGCLMKEVRLLRRAVFVVDRQGQVAYSSYMRAIGEEPLYNEVVEAVRSVLR